MAMPKICEYILSVNSSTDCEFSSKCKCMFLILYILGLEQCKAREDEAGKGEQNEDDGAAKDILIKRKVPPVMMGQAISVVGGYTEKPPTEAPTAVKRLPEPILPSSQTKWVLALLNMAQLLLWITFSTLFFFILFQDGRGKWEKKSVSLIRCCPAFIRDPD